MLAAVILAVIILPSCNKERDEAAKRALRALRKIEAATQVGVSYSQYSQLLIEAQAEVNEAKIKLPEGELKKELLGSMELYGNVGEIWSEQIRNNKTKDSRSHEIQQMGWSMASQKNIRIGELVGE